MPIEEQQSAENPANRERSTGCIPIELYDVMGDATTIPDGVVCEESTLVEETTPMPEPTMREMTGSMLTSGGSPKHQVEKDGTLIIEGDMLVRCADLLPFRRNYWDGQSPTPEARRQMRQAHNERVRVCTKAGFPPDKTPQSP